MSAVAARGLSSQEARQLLQKFGPNAVAEARPRPLLAFLKKFWAPVPWMLEAAILLECLLRKFPEALIIALLLVFNAGLSLVQERRAANALELLRSRLPLRARVLRDARWQTVPGADLVPGDYVHLRMGDLSPADVLLAEGDLLLDQSTLTGESLPVDAGPGHLAYAGAVVKRGEASGEVKATGARTNFGKTAELVRTAATASHLQELIFRIVKYLVAMDAVLLVILVADSHWAGLPLLDVLPFALILLVASIPVALPATFTLAGALGSLELASKGVLTTRLSAIEEAAAMDVLCSDKTGTITQNKLAVAELAPLAPAAEKDVLLLAAAASDEASQDPIDLAILLALKSRFPQEAALPRSKFVPFTPATKTSEAELTSPAGPLTVVKGAPLAVAARCPHPADLAAVVGQMSQKGYRVLAVASGPRDALTIAGLIAIEDPPWPDSPALIANLQQLGVRVVMVTGDGLATAQAVAQTVGILGDSCPADALRQPGTRQGSLHCNVFAGVYPEDKFHLVQSLQAGGHVVGMTGDGVNDAPALKQAEVGIAVANATDVAKAAASIVLTTPGLGNVLAAVQTSRRIYQRMLTYTLNKIIKTIEIAVFLTAGVIFTKAFIITPLLIVLLLFTNDFVTMSIATDRVSWSQQPDRWKVRPLMESGFALGSMVLLFSFGLFLWARSWLRLPLAALQTLVFLTLVFTGQGTVYLVRERGHFWRTRPSAWLLGSSLADIVVVSLLAWRGILMAPLPLWLILSIFAASAAWLALLDFPKTAILRHQQARAVSRSQVSGSAPALAPPPPAS